MVDRILREDDTGLPLVDADDEPLAELEVDRVDSVADRGATVAELASGAQQWRFGHVIVDEAQDLTPMQWRMVARRARGGSMTIVGDLAQRTTGDPGSWDDHLPDVIRNVTHRELTVNYRSPAEVNEVAAAVLAQLAPGLAPARSIRSSGHLPTAIAVEDLERELPALVQVEAREFGRGKMAVIGHDLAEFALPERCQVLDPVRAKGLEFDSVIVVEPARLLDERHGLRLLFIALTRTTRRLTVVHQRPLPAVLRGLASRTDCTDHPDLSRSDHDG